MSDCGCGCGGSSAMSASTVRNRPGQPTLDYRVGRYGDFRAAMHAALSDPSRPTLARLLTRDDDDPTIALIDAWAVACDILAFYTERLAVESYLGTATERASLQELGRLVAYRLAPGAAAETSLAFAVEPPPPAPPGRPTPGSLPPTVPDVVTVPVGLRVQSIPAPGERAQTFETLETIDARADWNAMPVVTTQWRLPYKHQREAWFRGTDLSIMPGQAILLVGDAPLQADDWAVRLVTDAEIETETAKTHVTWDGELGSDVPWDLPADRPHAFVLRKRLRVFGHQAPMWRTMDLTWRTAYVGDGGDPNQEDWPDFDAVTPFGEYCVVDLDGSQPDVVAGSWVVLSQEGDSFCRELFRVMQRSETSRDQYAISNIVTRLVLEGENTGITGNPRAVSVLAVSDPIDLASEPLPETALVTDTVVVEGDATAMGPGRWLLLTGVVDGTPAAEELELVSAAPVALLTDEVRGTWTSLHLRAAPTKGFTLPTATVHGNVARGGHGESVTEVLGSGDARQAFQRFALHQLPLTYVQADSPTGAASTLVVRVGDVAWHETETAYDAGPADRVFTTSTRPDGGLDVVFGDGVRGRRPPTGSQNLRAEYRKGLGAAGNLAAGQLSQLLDRPLGLRGVTNPLPSEGGTDPEDPNRARTSIPLGVRTLGRAVSLRDYSDFALAFVGIGLADAAVLTLRSGRTIVVTVTGPGGAPVAGNTAGRLEDTLHASGDPHVPVVVVAHTDVRFTIAINVATDPDHDRTTVLAALELTLRATFSPAVRLLGQPVHRSEVIAVAASVPGVVAVDLDSLYVPPACETLADQIVARAARVESGQAVGTELVSLSDAPFRMEVMPT